MTPITAKALSDEIGLLRRTAGLQQKACAHMFRHRFCTKLFLTLIEQHDCENIDDVRRALIDSHVLKQQALQWTGHLNSNSLDHYINLAFKEISAESVNKTLNTLNLKNAAQAFNNRIEQLVDELQNGLEIKDFISQYIELKKLVK